MRAIDSAGSKRSLKDFQIQSQKSLGKYRIYAFSYRYKENRTTNGYSIYKQEEDGEYELKMDTLTFPMEGDSYRGMKKEGLYFAQVDELLFAVGIVLGSEPSKYEIKSGNMIIKDEYRRDDYFIKAYLLEKPDQFSMIPLE